MQLPFLLRFFCQEAVKTIDNKTILLEPFIIRDTYLKIVSGYSFNRTDRTENYTIRSEEPLGIADLSNYIPGGSKENDSVWGADLRIRGIGRGAINFLIDGKNVNAATVSFCFNKPSSV